MTDSVRSARSGRSGFTRILILVNAGLLAALIFGPNLGHANRTLSYAGLVAVAAGCLLMLRYAVRHRRRTHSSRPKAL